jgi:anti-sigma factor RsiW
MNCQKVETYLSAYLDGEVTLSERRAVEAHVCECTDCQASLESLSILKSHLGYFPEVEIPEGLEDRLCRAVFDGETSVRERNRTWGLMATASLTAAAVVFVSLQVWSRNQNTNAATAPQQIAHTQPVASPVDPTGSQPPLFLVTNGR